MQLPKNSIGGALSLQIQHKTRLQLFADFSSDDVLSAVLLSDSEDDSESIADDDSNDDHEKAAMEIDDHEAESQFEHIDDIATTLPMPYHGEIFSKIDLLEATLQKLKTLNAPTPTSLSPTGWEKHLRKLLVGQSEPAYRVCRQHGSSSRHFLKSTRKIQKWEAIGVLVGRLIETKRWEKEHALKRKKAQETTTSNAVDDLDNLNKDIELDSSSFRWEITSESLKKISNGGYSGPDLMIDLQEAANELVHLHDPFWEEEGACGEEANTELYTSLIKDPTTGVSLPTTVLYSTREIEAGEMLTVNWDDAYWSEVSEKENLTAAATAWGSLHFPLLQLRDLAFRNGIPVGIVAPYYPDEIENYKRQKKEIQCQQELGGRGGIIMERSSPSILLSDEKFEEGIEQLNEEENLIELEPTEILDVLDDSEDESIHGDGGGADVEGILRGGEEEEEDFAESETGPSIRIELDTSSHMGTFTDGKCSDEELYNTQDGKQGRKKKKKKKKNETIMLMDSEGTWWLDDGNSPRLLIEGAYSRRTASNISTASMCTSSGHIVPSNATLGENTMTMTTSTSTRGPLSPRKISLFRHEETSKHKKEKPFQPFRAISKEELAKLKYRSHCDFSQVPEVDLKKITKYARQAHELPQSVLESIDTGICPKVQVTEIMSLHHPVRFLTRPDRPAYGVNLKPGCRLLPNEPLGIYVGEVWSEKGYLEARGQDVDQQMYTYSMAPCNLAECVGYPPDWVEKNADSKFPTLMVDAYSSGNVMRFINDVYARAGNPKPNVGAEACVDPRTGLPYMMMRWISDRVSEENAELMVDYGATQYWKVGGRALHRDLKRHAEVAFTAIVRLKAVLKERGISEELIEAAAEPVDIEKIMYYQKAMG
jgi:hypothetical protein